MKKSISILLLFSLILPFLGTSVYFQYRKQQIRREIREKIYAGLDKKEIILLKFTVKDAETRLDWKHDAEFEYRGQMYDIVEKKQEGDINYYYCYKDNKETTLTKEITRTASKALGQDPCQKSQTEKLTNFFKTVYQQNTFSWNPLSLQPSIFQYSTFNLQFSSLSLSPPAPPPKYT